MLRSDASDAHRLSLSDALSISENRSSQGESTAGEALLASEKKRVWHPRRGPDMGCEIAIRQPQTLIMPGQNILL